MKALKELDAKSIAIIIAVIFLCSSCSPFSGRSRVSEHSGYDDNYDSMERIEEYYDDGLAHAYDEGYSAGYDEGYDDGYEDALLDAADDSEDASAEEEEY